MWRPENWVNKYAKEEWHTDVEWTREDVAIGFEAGADTMLEGLKEQHGVRYEGGSAVFHRLNGEHGTLVFIPDDTLNDKEVKNEGSN